MIRDYVRERKMAFEVGKVLGNYRLLRLLGRGGFADVYLAMHIYLKTYVAIKVLSMQLTNDDIEHFSEEARIIASLDHPHILRVIDFGIERGIPYLVMDYAPNGSLLHIYPRRSFLPLGTVILYMKQIALALQYIHDKKLIHRDIKPDNLLIGRNGEILISDFDIAVMAHSTRSLGTGNAYGTIHYMAPEQIQGKPRFASDQYALGIIVYGWLCGTPPFHGTVMEIGMQHLLTSPQPLGERLSTISQEVAQVVLKALAKDPHQGYENVRIFVEALEQANTLPKVRVVSTYIDHSPTPRKVTWSPDSQYIASTSGDSWTNGGAIQVWNAIHGAKTYTYKFKSDVIGSTIWIADVLYAILVDTAYDGEMRIMSTLSKEEINVFNGESRQFVDIAWSPNGKFIAIVAGDNQYIDMGPAEIPEFNGFYINQIEVRNAMTGETISSYNPHNIHDYDEYYIENVYLIWSPDSKKIAFSIEGEDLIAIWQVNSAKDIFYHQGLSGHIMS